MESVSAEQKSEHIQKVPWAFLLFKYFGEFDHLMILFTNESVKHILSCLNPLHRMPQIFPQVSLHILCGPDYEWLMKGRQTVWHFEAISC